MVVIHSYCAIEICNLGRSDREITTGYICLYLDTLLISRTNRTRVNPITPLQHEGFVATITDGFSGNHFRMVMKLSDLVKVFNRGIKSGFFLNEVPEG